MGDLQQPRSRFNVRPWLPWFALAWAGVLWWTIGFPRVGGWAAAGLAVFIALAGWRWLPSQSKWLSPVSLIWFCWSSLAVIGVVSSQGWQIMILLASVAFLAWQLTHDQSQVHDRTTTRLTHLLTGISLFFSWMVLLSFGVGVVWLLPWWWLPIGAAGLTVLAAAQVWSGAGIPWKRFRGSLFMVGLSGASLMLATWWLPTVVYVGSIVAVTAVTLWLLTLRHVWLGDWQAGRGRRYLVVGVSIIGLILVTARWQ